ncbi:hypothetical protein [Pectobacterium brasiliense]|uniref:hypothetical protein n=1 Tax=Pectobacterium brasiliense TaxID=180957 RepID=UPI0032EFD01E
MADNPCLPPYGPLLRNVEKRSRRFFMADILVRHPSGRCLRNVEKRSRRFFMADIPVLHPSRRCCATLKNALFIPFLGYPLPTLWYRSTPRFYTLIFKIQRFIK